MFSGQFVEGDAHLGVVFHGGGVGHVDGEEVVLVGGGCGDGGEVVDSLGAFSPR